MSETSARAPLFSHRVEARLRNLSTRSHVSNVCRCERHDQSRVGRADIRAPARSYGENIDASPHVCTGGGNRLRAACIAMKAEIRTVISRRHLPHAGHRWRAQMTCYLHAGEHRAIGLLQQTTVSARALLKREERNDLSNQRARWVMLSREDPEMLAGLSSRDGAPRLLRFRSTRTRTSGHGTKSGVERGLGMGMCQPNVGEERGRWRAM